jgi:hypothetical protein
MKDGFKLHNTILAERIKATEKTQIKISYIYNLTTFTIIEK